VLVQENPKTGSQSVRAALSIMSLKPWKNLGRHSAIDHVKHLVNYKNYYCVCVVRNPWDVMVSSYFQHRSKNSERNEKFYWSTRLTVSEWIKKIGRIGTAHTDDNVNNDEKKTYYGAVTVGGQVVMDRIYNFAYLQDFVKHVAERIGSKPPKLPHKNKRNRAPYQEYYDKEAKALVAKNYAWAIAMFGFQFDDGISGKNFLELK
jgi:hypothetical protein